jgi:hypothetical protein
MRPETGRSRHAPSVAGNQAVSALTNGGAFISAHHFAIPARSILTCGRSHIDEHVKPYVCLSEECSPDFRYYTAPDTWADHMDESHGHEWTRWVFAFKWICDIEHDKKEVFTSQEDFEHHMEDASLHPRRGHPTDRQLVTLTRRKMKLDPRGVHTCPFSETVPNALLTAEKTANSTELQHRLSKHVGEHVKSLAYLSHHLLEPELAPTCVDEPADKSADESEALSAVVVRQDGMPQAGLYDLPSLGSLRDSAHADATRPQHQMELGSYSETSSASWAVPSYSPISPSVIQGLQGGDGRLSESLSNRIAEELVESAFDGRRYLPESSIDRLITAETIRDELCSIETHVSDGLLDFILARAKRIFATLAFIDRAGRIEQFFQRNFSDDMLPIAVVAGTKAVNSLPRETVLTDIFSSWDASDLVRFSQVQWQYLAPVFIEGDFQSSLHRDCPLPITSLDSVNTRTGSFSLVRKVTVHPGHLRLSSFVRSAVICRHLDSIANAICMV